jgi:hypothetical protein
MTGNLVSGNPHMLLVPLALLILATPKVHPVCLCVPALDLQLRQEGRHTSAIGGTERGDVGVLEGRDDVDETGPLARVRQAVALGDKIRAKAVIFFKLVRVSIGILEVVRRIDGRVYGIWGMQISLPAGSSVGSSVARNGGIVIGSRGDQGAATKRVGEEIKTVEDHRAPEDRPGQE